MPAASQTEVIYSRGRYQLAWIRDAQGKLRTPFPQIVWYDEREKRTRRQSAGTDDVELAERALDALFEKNERGRNICPTCGHVTGEGHYLVTEAVTAYVASREQRTSISAIRARLTHILDWLDARELSELTCEEITADRIEDFRAWARDIPVIEGTKERERSPSTIEGSVRQLAAVINYAYEKRNTPQPATFRPLPPSQTDRTPTYRADINMLAAMFDYCLNPKGKAGKMRERHVKWRRNLLRFLQISVATWARPDAAHDVSTDPARDQWHPRSAALNLNPKGRVQTKKYRPVVPIARQVVPLLKETKGFFVTVTSVRAAFEEMQDELQLPRDRETGLKLIRRSMASLGRKRLGERGWIEGQIMLGHIKASKVSEIYAPFEAGYLADALAVTESIIDEIQAIVPGAFGDHDSRTIHGDGSDKR